MEKDLTLKAGSRPAVSSTRRAGKAIGRKQLDEMFRVTPQMNATARMVLTAYASTMYYGDDPQETWQSEQSLAGFAGVSIETLDSYTKALMDDGYLILSRTEKLGNNRVRRYWMLGRGELSSPRLKRRVAQNVENLVPGARHKLSQVAESVQEPVLEAVQNRPMDEVEKNTNSIIKMNKEQPPADRDSAGAPSRLYHDDKRGLGEESSFIVSLEMVPDDVLDQESEHQEGATSGMTPEDDSCVDCGKDWWGCGCPTYRATPRPRRATFGEDDDAWL